jgi:hypothetical protein
VTPWYAPAAPWLLLVALQTPPQGALARPIVAVEVDPSTVAVGQPFAVRVRVRALPGATIHFPAVPDSAGSIEAVDPRAIEDRSTSAVLDQTAVYRFIGWEPGRRTVPLGDVSWDQSRGREVLSIGAVRVDVTSALPADTVAQEPRDARDPFDPPPGWWRWALGAVVALAVAFMSWRSLRRRRSVAAPADAYVDAQAAFAAVEQLAFDDAGEPGRAVLAYAEVMREYLTRRFPPATVGLTTPEYVRTLAGNSLPILPEEVQGVLACADAVKFAGAAVDASGVAAVARAARGIVRDVQVAYEARLAAADKGPPRRPRGRR